MILRAAPATAPLIIFGAEDVSDARRAVEVCLREVERTMGDVYGSPAGHLEFQYTARASHALNKASAPHRQRHSASPSALPPPSACCWPDTAVKAATVDGGGLYLPANGGTSFSNEVILTFTGDSGAVKQAIIAARDVGHAGAEDPGAQRGAQVHHHPPIFCNCREGVRQL